MKRIAVQNLVMIVNDLCNLICKHCLRGEQCNIKMSDEVINATLNQIDFINNLCISGGEPLLSLDVIEKIFNYIIDNHVSINRVNMMINGTIYNEDFLKLLEEMKCYIAFSVGLKKNAIKFTISDDIYHQEERKRLNLEKEFLENIKKYAESKYYFGTTILDPNSKIIREGNAELLDKSLTKPLKPVKYFITYFGYGKKYDRKYGICNIGPFVTINPKGIITECNASFEHQETLYNYGNVINDEIEAVMLERGKVLRPRRWLRETKRIIDK